MAPKKLHLCLEGQASTIEHCYICKYSQQGQCTSEVKRLLPIFAMLPTTTVNGIINSRKKSEGAKSWK